MQSLTSLKVRHGREHTTVGEQGFWGPDTTRLVPAREDIEFGVDEPPRGYRVIQCCVQGVWLAHGWARDLPSPRAQFIHSNHVCAVLSLRHVTQAIPGLSEVSYEGPC